MESVMGIPGTSMQTRAALMRVLRALEAALPAKEVSLSLHSQAMKDATLRTLPGMDLFTEASRDHLAAIISTAGYIRRLLSGDTSRTVWLALQAEMMSLHPAFVAARDAYREIMRADAAQQSAVLQSLNQVLGVVEQVHQGVLSTVQPLATIEVGGAVQQTQQQVPQQQAGS